MREKNYKMHRCLIGRRKEEMNSSELDRLCKLIKQKAAILFWIVKIK